MWGTHRSPFSLTISVRNSRQRRDVQAGGRDLSVLLLVFLLAFLVVFSPGLTN